MTALDLRPGTVDLIFWPGNDLSIAISWPGSHTSGHTYSAFLDRAALPTTVSADVVTVTLLGGLTQENPEPKTWQLLEDGQVVITGQAMPSTTGTIASSVSCSVQVDTAQVTLTGVTSDLSAFTTSVAAEAATRAAADTAEAATRASADSTETAARIAADALKANDNAVVHLTGNETIAGTKTFSSAPAVPDGSFTEAKVTGLVADLSAKASQAALDAEIALARNADNLTSGTVADARIPSTIARDSETTAAVAAEATARANADALKADDSAVVHKASAETATGVKTFSAGLITKVVSGAPSDSLADGVVMADLTDGGLLWIKENGTYKSIPVGRQCIDLVAHFDCVGDGTTAEATKVQNAVNRAAILGVPCRITDLKSFLCESAITFPSGVEVVGRGTLLGSTTTVVQSASGGSTSNIKLRDFTVSSASDTTHALVLLQDTTAPDVENVTVVGGRWGLEFLNATRARARRCEVSGQAGAATPVGIFTTGTSSFADIQDNYVHDNAGLGIFFDSVSSSQTILGHKCKGNRVRNVTDNGIRFQTNPSQPDQRYYVCTGNYVENASIDQIRVTGSYATVANNVCVGGTNGQGGIRDTGAGSTVLTKSVITGNVCLGTSSTSGGIELHAGASDVVISANHCEGWAHGINFLGTDSEITGNTCILNQGAGIFLQGATSTTVAGNRCKNNGISATRGGIELNSTCSDNTITGNRCTDDRTPKLQAYGINVASGADFNVISNNDVQGNLTENLRFGASTSNNQQFNNLGYIATAGGITVGASPFQFKNQSHGPVNVRVQGGTVSKIEVGHTVAGTTTFYDTGLTQGVFWADVNDYVRVTYSVAPTMTKIPLH